MTQARLRIVGPSVHDLKYYYFSLEEAAHNLEVTESWILEQDIAKTRMWGTWYFHPDDYHKLRDLMHD